jgi:ribonucleoside-triphosphate reductase
MRTIEQIDQEISSLNEKLKQVKGTETEVYTRIVGYHRAVDNWNKGKREEYNHRKEFVLNSEALSKDVLVKINAEETKEKKEKVNTTDDFDLESISGFKLFTSQYCHNCSPVKNFLNNLHVRGEEVDVSTDLGINIAKDYNVMSTPTVILFDKDDNIVSKAFSVEELKKVFLKKENLFLKN